MGEGAGACWLGSVGVLQPSTMERPLMAERGPGQSLVSCRVRQGGNSATWS